MFRDIWINLANQAFEVSRFERRVGFENEYPFRQKQLVFKHVSSSCFVSCRYSFVQPLPHLSGVAVIEVTNRSFRERLAKRRHAFLPFLLTDRRQAVNVAEMVHRKLRV